MDTPAKILVVEDEVSLREALTTALGYENFTVITAGDGEEGLATALREHPDVTLLDITMPKMDGLEMLGELRKDAWGATAKVIVMTALDDLEKVAEVMEKGVDEYVVKSSMTLGDIIAKIKTKLGK